MSRTNGLVKPNRCMFHSLSFAEPHMVTWLGPSRVQQFDPLYIFFSKGPFGWQEIWIVLHVSWGNLTNLYHYNAMIGGKMCISVGQPIV